MLRNLQIITIHNNVLFALHIRICKAHFFRNFVSIQTIFTGMGFFSVEYVIGQDNCIEMLKEEVIQAEDEKKDLSHTEQFY